MEENNTPPEREFTLPEPNPVTRESHRKDFFRRVILPLILVLVVITAIVVVFILLPVGDVETWAQISSIMLIASALLLGLATLVILGLLVYLVTYLLKLLPPYTRMAQEGIEKIKDSVEKGADIPVKPVIQVQSFISAISILFRRKS
ncbi:MAG: hypothetical protein JW757_04460 [Anaerolineales bacterium]|nr:hypothetical protein [Anaerolineales bacterium]